MGYTKKVRQIWCDSIGRESMEVFLQKVTPAETMTLAG